MILTVAEYQKYLPNTDDFFKAEKMEAFEIRALYKYFPKYIGSALTASMESANSNANLLAQVKPTLACLAILESVPFMDLIATNNGFAIVNNQNLAPASRDRVQSLREGCLVAANAYFDRMLLFLETNTATYTTWNKSCINSGSLLPGVTEFIAATKHHIDRHAFVEMIPIISAIENTSMKNELSAEFLTEIAASTTDTHVKPLLRQALAFATLSKMAMDTPDNQPVVTKYSHMAGKYMGQAMQYLVTHLSAYPTYSTYGYEAPFDNATDGEDYSIFIMG
jgi:hypothetical protein